MQSLNTVIINRIISELAIGYSDKSETEAKEILSILSPDFLSVNEVVLNDVLLSLYIMRERGAKVLKSEKRLGKVKEYLIDDLCDSPINRKFSYSQIGVMFSCISGYDFRLVHFRSVELVYSYNSLKYVDTSQVFSELLRRLTWFCAEPDLSVINPFNNEDPRAHLLNCYYKALKDKQEFVLLSGFD